MNREQYLLTCLMEECAEVIHIASKCIRFGLDSNNLGELEKTNAEELEKELRDLFSVVELLNGDEITELDVYNIKHSNKKAEKIERYMAYSRSLGRME